MVLALRGREMGLRQRARGGLAGAEQRRPSRAPGAGSGRRSSAPTPIVSSSGHEPSPPRIGGTMTKSSNASGALRSTASTRQRRRHDVVAEDVLELDRLGRRGDRVRVELGQLHVLLEDLVELALEAVELLGGHAEPGEVGDVFNIRARQSGHPRMIAEGPALPGSGALRSTGDRHGSGASSTTHWASPSTAGWDSPGDESPAPPAPAG